MSEHLNGFTPALELLQLLWTERPARTAQMQAKGSAKYRTLVTWPDGDVRPGVEKAPDRKTGEIVGDGEPLVITDAMLIAHINGTATYATPLIGADGLAQVLAIELDDGAEERARAVLNTMQAAGLTGFSIVCPGSDGHNGSHSYALYAQAWNPDRLQEQARQIAQAAGVSDKEVYPRGANLRLPFGKHQRTHTRGMLLLQDGQRFDLDTHRGLAEGAAVLATLPRNTLAPPAAPVKVVRDTRKPTSAGDVMPLTDYDQRAGRDDVERMLEGAGWEQTGGRGSVSYWARPGKSTRAGHSATLGYVADAVLSVFSTDDPDLPGEPGKGKHYGPAAIYVRLLHSGVATSAAKDLYAQGYGTRMAPAAEPRQPARAAGDERPRIGVRDLDIPQIVKPAWEALIAANEPPALFRRDNVLYALDRGDDGAMALVEVDKRRLRGRLARVAVFEDSREKQGKFVSWVVEPPSPILDDMLTRIDPRVPLISRITRCPIIMADGTIVSALGYHAGARVYYDPRPGLVVPGIADQPTPAQIAAARALIVDEMLGDFAFVSAADRAHAVALLLLPFARELIAGPTPLHVIEAPTPGSGKTLLASVLMRPALGADATPITEGRDDAEWQKKITSVLAATPAAVLIDNVNKPLFGSALSTALTSTIHSDRLLGSNTMTRYPIRCAWLATANNPTMSGEMARRSIRIRIDPKVDQPWKRDNFKHANLLAWTREHEGDLIAAALTLIRAGLQAEAPTLPPLGSFEHWTATLGRILHTAQIPGFLQNLDELYDRADTEGAAWRALIGAWWEAHQGATIGTGDIFDVYKAGEYDLSLESFKEEKAQKAAFGKRLRKQQDRVIGGYQVVNTGTKQRAQQWQLRPTSQSMHESEGCEGCEGFDTPLPYMREEQRELVGVWGDDIPEGF